MEKLVKQSKRWMSAFGVLAFLMVAGWKVGADGTGEVFSETEVALENAVAGSGNETICYNTITSSPGHQVRYCPSCSFIDDSAAPWYAPKDNC